MRYRAKRDSIVEHNGELTLVATGDKVFVTQHDGKWQVFSFYSRKIIGIFDEQSLNDLFGPESEFQKTPRDDRFKGRRFGNKVLALMLFMLPFTGMAQVNPVVWDWKAVRVDPNHFEFHLRAYISRGWWIYGPNMQDECIYSPIVTFERSPVMKPLEKMAVLEYLVYASNEGVQPPLCPIPQYTSNVTFMQLFRMPMDSSGTVKGQITFQAMSRYMAGPLMTVDFELHVGAEPGRRNSHGRIITTYPKGVFRKTWWFIKHPFGPYYISRSFYP